MIDIQQSTPYTGQDVSGWWASEKLDGVFARWDGWRLRSKEGNLFRAPAWFLAHLPPGVVADGELWGGHGTLDKTASTVRTSTPVDADWRALRFMAFDAPAMNDKPFWMRADSLIEIYNQPQWANGPLKPVKWFLMESSDEAAEERADIISGGGEGIMLINPKSLYTPGRAAHLLKWPDKARDEAVVVAVNGSSTKANEFGAIVCRWNERDITLPLKRRVDRLCPPRAGTVVTFSFKCITAKGMPREPVYIGGRDYE